MQSPGYHAEINGRRLVSSAGFFKIFDTGKVIIELSTQGEYLRKTIFGDNREKKEILYERIVDLKKRKWIEQHSENWYFFERGCISRYYVLQQLDANNRPIGYYKIIKKIKAKLKIFTHEVVAERSEDDWVYYERRGQGR